MSLSKNKTKLASHNVALSPWSTKLSIMYTLLLGSALLVALGALSVRINHHHASDGCNDDCGEETGLPPLSSSATVVNATYNNLVPQQQKPPCPEFHIEGKSIVHYLNPRLFEDPDIMEDIAESLQNDELVVIRNAFRPELAEAVHCDLDQVTDWELYTGASADGFLYHHHNLYNYDTYTPLLKAFRIMMELDKTKQWMSKLSGRNCHGDTRDAEASPGYYMPGDNSFPHSDYGHQRTVAYVWHLSKNWQPGWGGALYWAQEQAHHSYVHASFNTLSLFNVRPDSQHMVTTVSPHATEKRLSVNGWFRSDWIPSLEDDLEELLSTPEQRWDLTVTQTKTLRELILENDSDMSEDRLEELKRLVLTAQDETWQRGLAKKIRKINPKRRPMLET